jgi:hypothetical protein
VLTTERLEATMPSYVFLLYGDAASFVDGPDDDPSTWEDGIKKHVEWSSAVEASGARILGGEALMPPAAARTVRTEGADRLVMDGPFAEVKEALGGYYLIETTSLEAAVELAKSCPEPVVEVRPIVPTS